MNYKNKGKSRNNPVLWAFFIALAILFGIFLYASWSVLNNIYYNKEYFYNIVRIEGVSGNKIAEAKMSEKNVPHVVELFPILTVFVILLGFIATILQLSYSSWQNSQADMWKRNEFVSQQLILFNEDQSVKNFKRLLESIDVKYDTEITLDVAEKGSISKENVKINKQALMDGFTPAPGPFINVKNGNKEPIEENSKRVIDAIRIASEIDGFFFHLIGMRKFIDSKVITEEDLKPYVYYWFNLIIEPGENVKSEKGELKVFCEETGEFKSQTEFIRGNLKKYIKTYFNGMNKKEYKRGEMYFIYRTVGKIKEYDEEIRCKEGGGRSVKDVWKACENSAKDKCKKLIEKIRRRMEGLRKNGDKKMNKKDDWKSQSIFLRRLKHEDIKPIDDVIAGAFSSLEMGASIAKKLTYYCESESYKKDINEQEGPPIAVEYWAICNLNKVYGICGLYRMNWTWAKSFWLGWFAIDTEFQGSGLGTATLKTLVNIARAKGCEVLKVETEAEGKAVRFYRKFGFEEEGILSKHYAENMDAMVLSMAITEPLLECSPRIFDFDEKITL